jgi:O-antigen/teichoic acid export membrane protein
MSTSRSSTRPTNRMRRREGPDGCRQGLRAQLIGVGRGAGAALVMALLGPWALRLATPESHHVAADLIPLAAAVGALNVATAYAGAGVYFHRAGFAPLGANTITAIAALGLYAVAIPLWGLEGALAARGVSYMMRAGLCIALSHRDDRSERSCATARAAT